MQTVKGVETREVPECGKPLVDAAAARRGTFLGCSGYPECKYIKPSDGEDDARAAEADRAHAAPKCGKPMVQAHGQARAVPVCTRLPRVQDDHEPRRRGQAGPSAVETEHDCEKCGKPMVLREGRRGPFLACTGYPKCQQRQGRRRRGQPGQADRHRRQVREVRRADGGRARAARPVPGLPAYPKCRSTKPMPEDLKEKLKDMLPAAPPKKAMPAGRDQRDLPRVRRADEAPRRPRAASSWAARKYPKCKGTREAPPEVLEQVQAAGAV